MEERNHRWSKKEYTWAGDGKKLRSCSKSVFRSQSAELPGYDYDDGGWEPDANEFGLEDVSASGGKETGYTYR
jgi:hypothetical protein